LHPHGNHDGQEFCLMVDYCNYKMLGSEEELEPQTHSGMTKAELRRVMNVL